MTDKDKTLGNLFKITCEEFQRFFHSGFIGKCIKKTDLKKKNERKWKSLLIHNLSRMKLNVIKFKEQSTKNRYVGD